MAYVPPPPPKRQAIRSIPNDETGIEIIFQDADAMDPALNKPPNEEGRHLRHEVLPTHIHFIVRLKTVTVDGPTPAAMRSKVQTVKTFSQMESLTIARYSLRLNDVIGLRKLPDKAIWRLMAYGQKPDFVEDPDGSVEVVPTFVVHVPSHLNPGYQDRQIEFNPRSGSWLHHPHDHTLNTADGSITRPRVIVPLHLARDHPAKGHSTRHPGPHPRPPPHLSPREKGPREQVASVESAESHVAFITEAASSDAFHHRSWTDGWLPFSMHDQTARQAAVSAARRQASSGTEGWRTLFRKERQAEGEPKLVVDHRLIHEAEDELLGTTALKTAMSY